MMTPQDDARRLALFPCGSAQDNLQQAAWHGGFAKCIIRIVQQADARQINVASLESQIKDFARSSFRWADAYLSALTTDETPKLPALIADAGKDERLARYEAALSAIVALPCGRDLIGGSSAFLAAHRIARDVISAARTAAQNAPPAGTIPALSPSVEPATSGEGRVRT